MQRGRLSAEELEAVFLKALYSVKQARPSQTCCICGRAYADGRHGAWYVIRADGADYYICPTHLPKKFQPVKKRHQVVQRLALKVLKIQQARYRGDLPVNPRAN